MDVGYFDGRQSSRVWLVSTKDLKSMYARAKSNSDIFLWVQACVADDDDDSDDPGPDKKKRKLSATSRRQLKEDEVEEIYDELKLKHGEDYTSPQLKLWARMIHVGTHDDYSDPPHVPMITGIPPKRSKKDSLTEVIAGAAESILPSSSSCTHFSVIICTKQCWYFP